MPEVASRDRRQPRGLNTSLSPNTVTASGWGLGLATAACQPWEGGRPGASGMDRSAVPEEMGARSASFRGPPDTGNF